LLFACITISSHSASYQETNGQVEDERDDDDEDDGIDIEDEE
jgi:hypothetical protein